MILKQSRSPSHIMVIYLLHNLVCYSCKHVSINKLRKKNLVKTKENKEKKILFLLLLNVKEKYLKMHKSNSHFTPGMPKSWRELNLKNILSTKSSHEDTSSIRKFAVQQSIFKIDDSVDNFYKYFEPSKVSTANHQRLPPVFSAAKKTLKSNGQNSTSNKTSLKPNVALQTSRKKPKIRILSKKSFDMESIIDCSPDLLFKKINHYESLSSGKLNTLSIFNDNQNRSESSDLELTLTDLRSDYTKSFDIFAKKNEFISASLRSFNQFVSPSVVYCQNSPREKKYLSRYNRFLNDGSQKKVDFAI